MKTIKVNKSIFLFFSINEMLIADKNFLQQIKKKYQDEYDKVFIYDQIDLTNKKDIIRDKINKERGNNIQKIHGRKCHIRQIENNVDKSIFLNKYHIQGADKSEISYGIFNDNNLVGVMCFTLLSVEDNSYELSRFAIKSGIVIHGVFMKTIMKFIDEFRPHKIISFADLNHSNEKNIYTTNNFKLVKHIKPSYKLFDPNKNKKYHKFTYGNRFYRKHLSEYTSIENVHEKLNLKKIWNSGMLKYELYVSENQEIIYGFIYLIENQVNNKKYVGQTTRTLKKRIYEYKSAFNRDDFHNDYLRNSFYKYGFENFKFSILDSGLNQVELNSKEIFWINYYNTNDKNHGYNIEVGGNNAIPSIETRGKMSVSHSGIKQSENWVKNRIALAGSIDAKKYGKMKTEEEKMYLSEISPKFWLGKTRDLAPRKPISLPTQDQLPSNIKKVEKYDIINNLVIDTYLSTTDAARQNKEFSQSKISRICNNKAKTNKDFSFRFAS